MDTEKKEIGGEADIEKRETERDRKRQRGTGRETGRDKKRMRETW